MLMFSGETVEGQLVDSFSLDKCLNLSFALLAVSSDFSSEYAKTISQQTGGKCIVIDCSTSFG